MQVLFIAPVHGGKKLQITCSNDVEENENYIHHHETKGNDEFFSRTLDLTKKRLANIVKRPARSGSKVYHTKQMVTLIIIRFDISVYII